ncbi:MAG: NADH:flavin oxidoreductase [Deltaproteobacteria bacterium]|nr:NADH:flavin oxidoreductase [Deltaproteobacteria bacterium]
MSILFESMKIGGLRLRNRFVRSATYDGCADKAGHVTEKQIRLFEELARGGVGLIVSGIASVHASGRISAFQNIVSDDSAIPGLKKLVDAANSHGAGIAMQLFHGGRESSVYQKHKKSEAISPSVIANDPYCDLEHRAMTEDEIFEVIQAFGDAAVRARAAGFDAVQVHGAHAYLPSQFLSPFTNQRTDAWGGSPEKRLRFLHEIYKDIRKKVGDDYPVMIKIGVADGFAGGLEFSEGKAAAVRCAEWGFDAIEISQGLRGKRYSQTEFRTKIKGPDQEGYFRSWCREIKEAVKVPVMMVGGLRRIEMMEEVIRNRDADYISLCRPLIREPDIISRWEKGQGAYPTCVSCNLCFEALLKGKPLNCVHQLSVNKKKDAQPENCP